MIKKGLVTLVCLTVMSALWSWAATTYSISTKINSLGTKAVTVDGKLTYQPVIGGTIKVRDNAAFNLGTVYSNFTTSAFVPVVVDPEPGYKISALTQNGTTVAVSANQTAPFTVQFKKPAVLKTQTLVATFSVESVGEVKARTWQLQIQNQNGGGNLTVTRGLVTDPAFITVGKPLVKNYLDTTPVSVKVDAADGYRIEYIIVNGIKALYTTDLETVSIDPKDGSRVRSVVAAYKKKPLPVTTDVIEPNTPKPGQIGYIPNGISPINPNADVYGTVRLTVIPTGSNNYVETFVAKAGTVQLPAAQVKLTDRFGDAVTLPFRGPVKVTITGITSAITVEATYKKDNVLEMGSCTKTCHLQSSNAVVLAVPAKWEASAHFDNAVDCVTCHQTMPGPVLATTLCTGCHTNATATLSTEFAASSHAGSDHGDGICQRCHGHNGALVGNEVGFTGGEQVMGDHAAAVVVVDPFNIYSTVSNSASVTCATCHNPHGGFRAINTYNGTAVVKWDPNQNAKNDDQYDLCTSCHGLTGNDGAELATYHKDRLGRTFTTHYDDPTTGLGSDNKALAKGNIVEGYVVRAKGNTPCADCHNVHSADITVQQAWAKSAHAGKLAENKESALYAYVVAQGLLQTPAVTPETKGPWGRNGKLITFLEKIEESWDGVKAYRAGGALDDHAGNGWTHYNWDLGSRSDCQRCHTSTGLANFLDSKVNKTTYVAADNNFGHLANWTAAAGSPQNELLYCWGCHNDAATGALRNPGALTEVYSGTPTVSVTYPSVGKSNVCMACHLGRETGSVVAASTLDFTNLSFINSHYLAAGASIFNESGYEYAGQSYAIGGHRNVGAANGAGPCVACHMTSAEGHSFEIVAKNAAGVITAVETTTCASCHGTAMTAAKLEADKATFHTAMEALKTALANKGILFANAHPYFYKDLNGNGVMDAAEQVSTNAFKNWDGVAPGKGKDVMGAAFNYNLFEHDPGAYAHNRGYALKLIADSIDFLADGAVNGAGSFNIIPVGGTVPVATDLLAIVKPVKAAGFATATCSSCHTEAAAEWATSNHANSNNSPATSGCATACHKPTGEINASGSFMVGCAACHGEGQPVGTTNAIVSCASCHDRAVKHSSHGPNVVALVAASKHHITAAGEVAGHASAGCQRCHTLEGYVAFGESGNAFDGTTNGTFPGVTAVQNVSCAACHDPHTGTLRATPGWDVGSAQYDLCTSCHNLTNAAGKPVASGVTVSGVETAVMQQHGKDWYRNIASTHYDLATTGVNTAGAAIGTDANKTIEGYVIRKDSATACTDCHGHELYTNTGKALDAADVADVEKGAGTIHTDWAQSAHAGGLLKKKWDTFAAGGTGFTAKQRNTASAAAVMAVGATDSPVGNAWAHYNWDAAGRADCQHCHTATGAANYLKAAATNTAYVKTANNFDHLSGWNATDGSPQQELMYCWGCHSNAEAGTLIATGAITLDYTVNGAALALTPADGKSSSCISCHTGRGNSETLLGAATMNPSGAALAAPGTKSHYLTAGMTINQVVTKAGYTFGLADASYADKAYYAHDTIGCADCHMTSANSHSFGVVAKDATGAITKVVSTKCFECHTGAHGAALVSADVLDTDGVTVLHTAAAAAAFMEEEAEGFHGGLSALSAALVSKGITPTAGYPYFTGTAANQGVSGAMYNYSFLHHEPGAYAHNMMLAKRLIYDSIDWLDNYAMDNSVVIPATNAHARAWFGANEVGAVTRP